MSENFVRFRIETPWYTGRIDNLDEWKSAVRFHVDEKYYHTIEEAVVTLLKATQIRSGVDRLPKFNIDPAHPRHSLPLRDWAAQQDMDLLNMS